MAVSFIPNKFPANDATDGQYLYRSLGSFWTQLFQDKNALQGYTIGTAEELIQLYYNLLEVVNQYSVEAIDLYHKEKWKPLVIKKSEFNKAPFVFEANSAVFGYQPSTDPLYPDTLFRFGYPKESDAKSVFSFTPDFELKNFAALANRVIAPSFLLLPGVDTTIQGNTIYFNSDIFSNDYVIRTSLVDDYGNPVVYQDSDGNTYEDEFVILWMHYAEIDNQELYKNFGVLFDLKLPSGEKYKELLKALMNFAVEGPTVTALNIVFSAIANSPVFIDPKETIEDVFDDDTYRYVITDKNVYRLRNSSKLKPYVLVGAEVNSGEPVSSSVTLTDIVKSQNWWMNDIEVNKLGFPSHVFAADIKHQLFFENKEALLRHEGGILNFPVYGTEGDMEEFKKYINLPSNKQQILEKLNLPATEDAQVSVNPLDFIFSNFFKNNTALLRLELSSAAEINDFFNLFISVRSYLPPHVYILVYLTLGLSEDELVRLNNALAIPGFDNQLFSMDGSVSLTGARPSTGPGDAEYYKDYKDRLFCVSISPSKNNNPLHYQENLDELTMNSARGETAEGAGIAAGTLRTHIPEYIYLPGDDTTPQRPSTREIPAIFLIDF